MYLLSYYMPYFFYVLPYVFLSGQKDQCFTQKNALHYGSKMVELMNQFDEWTN